MDIEKLSQKTLKRVMNRIYAKIPELNDGWEQVFISTATLKRLTDEEFILLWDLPDVTIEVSEKTAAYVDKRKEQLGLA